MRSRRAIKLGYGTSGTWVNLGIAHLHLSNDQAALEAYERAYALKPRWKDHDVIERLRPDVDSR